MRRWQEPWLYLFLFLMVPIQSIWALDTSKTNEKATLIISAGNAALSCNKSFQKSTCVVQVGPLQCFPAGFVTIANSSKNISAINIQPFSMDSNYRTYVVPDNRCPFVLAPGQSCSIYFSTNTSISFFVPSVLIKGNNTTASFIDMSANTCSPQAATISVPANAVIPFGNSVDITVTNTSPIPANNVQINLPAAWTSSGVTSTTCPVIPGNGTCNITITSSGPTPFVAQGGILVTGDNVSSPPTIALAFSVNGFLVYSVIGNTSLVIANTDFSPPDSWGMDFNIPGITETSTNPPDNCNGATDGTCNTDIISSFISGGAANDCFFGMTPMGTWFLPSICELGVSGSAGCPAANFPNIYTLYSLGFTDGILPGQYWSSTESSSNPSFDAWFFNFATNTQGTIDKSTNMNIRCARAF